jgi:hypothetical protein
MQSISSVLPQGTVERLHQCGTGNRKNPAFSYGVAAAFVCSAIIGSKIRCQTMEMS